MASNMGLIGSFIVLSALLMGSTEGTVYTVGDSLGWRFPPNETFYSDWASTKTFFVGDKLKFAWTGTHTVADTSKADYDSCTNPGIVLGSDVTINLLHTGPRYFICTVGEHCSRGMKFSINVQSSGNAAAEAPNALPPSSSASTLSFSVFPLFLSLAAAYFSGRF